MPETNFFPPRLRPLLNAELTYGLDLVLRRTARRARSTLRHWAGNCGPTAGRGGSGIKQKKGGSCQDFGGAFFFCVFFFLIVGVNLEDNWMVVSSCCFSMFTPIWAPVLFQWVENTQKIFVGTALWDSHRTGTNVPTWKTIRINNPCKYIYIYLGSTPHPGCGSGSFEGNTPKLYVNPVVYATVAGWGF